MPVSFTGCCLWGLGSAADWLGLHKPLPAVRGDEHALPVEGCGQSQQGQSQQGQSQQGQSQQGQSQQGSPEPSPARHANGSASTHGGKAGGGEEASASTSPASKSGRGSLRKLPVVLRVEVASKISAQVLTWGVIVINTLFVWLAIVLLSLRQSDTWTVGQLRPYYQAEVVLGSIALGSLLLAGLWFGLSVWRSTREQRVWSKRQRYFGSTAAVLLALQSGYSAAYVASYGVVLSATNCAYPFNTLSVLEFVQWAFFISAMLFLLARLHNVMVYRGLGALDMHPNFRLVVDRPLSERPRQNKWILIAWAVLVMLGVLNMIDKFRRYPHLFPNPRCDIELNKLQCPPNAIQISTASVYLVIILLFVAYWLHSLYHATRDHELLPWHKYRMSLIYIRIQARVFGPVISAVILSTIFLGLIPSFTNSCWAAIDAQLGNLPVDLALSLAAIIMSLLYAPKARALDSPMLQDFFQAFAWTEAGLEKAVERRNRQLLDPGSSTTTSSNTGWPGLTTQVSFTRVVEAVESAAAYLPGKMAQLAGVQDPETAAAKLREEPCFCMEAAVKLFYWMRLAYREDDVLDHKFVNAAGGLELFDLQHFETIWDESTDTHCVVGWSDTTCVVAFRGTQTMQNVLTDLKAWMAPLQPEAHHNGTLCKVHAGFLSAWLHHGFSEKVLARLRELDSNKGQPLRFWVCGHSLGGALATLAALRIRQQHPMSQLTVITYGCPRVGNRAFSTLFDQTVSDCWAIVNDLDPIPWVPKWCFHRVGKRVIIDGRGNLILRPSYFEVSVTHRGTSAKHHLTGGYALSLAAIFRAQFVPSKALLGGAQGVAALEAAVDLGKALQLTNMDLESLRDPAKLPELSEVLAAKREAQRRSRAGSSRRQLSRSLSCGNASLLPACCDTRPAVVGGGEESRHAGIGSEGVEAPRSARWWCCGAGPWPPPNTARSGSGSINVAASQQSQQQQPAEVEQQQQQQAEQQQHNGEVQLAEAAAPPPPTPAADAAAAASSVQSGKSLGKQHSYVHIRRFSTMLLRGSRPAAGSSRGSRAGAADAAGGHPTGQLGTAVSGQPEDGEEPLQLHSVLSHPDSIVLDTSGSWLCLPSGSGAGQGQDAGGGPSRQLTGGRRGPQRYDRA